MIGPWLRIEDPLLTDEIGWHLVRAAAAIDDDVDGRHRIEFACDVVVVESPKKLHAGLPIEGERICRRCSLTNAQVAE